MVYEATARPKTAFQYYARSMDAAEQGGDAGGQARVWLDLGRLLTNAAVPRAGRQSAAAAACYRAALRLTTTSGDVARRPTTDKQRPNDVGSDIDVVPNAGT